MTAISVFCAIMLLSLTMNAVAASDNGHASSLEPAIPSMVAQCPTRGACDLIVHHWLFTKDKHGAGQLPSANAQWQQVRLPHTPVREPLLVNDQWQGTMWYKTQLQLPSERHDQHWWLVFDGAMNVADVYLNGMHVRHHMGGYLPFTVDMTAWLATFGKDAKQLDIMVRLDNRDHALTGLKPLQQLDFNPYGGLYRPVTLALRPAVHITSPQLSRTPAGGGVVIRYPHISREQATVLVTTEVQAAPSARPHQAPIQAQLSQQLFRDGTLVSQGKTTLQLHAGQPQSVQQTLAIDKPQLWSPQQPALYQLVTELTQGEQVVEKQLHHIGLRTIEFDAQHQLRINGEKTFLRGVNRHQEFPHLGYAVGPLADERDAYRIKAAGFDYVRLSHYPQSEAFMAAADRLGLLLLDAIPGWQYLSMDPAFADAMVENCRNLIRRSRNHPSILAYECSLNETDMPPALVARLHQTVKQEAPWAYSAGWVTGYDIYLQARQHRLQHYQVPTQPYVVSEYGDWEYYAQNAGFAQHQWQGLQPEARTSRQLLSSGETRLLQQASNLQEAHNDNLRTPAFADGYWVMFDYNRGYANDLEASGLMSIYRQPKYSYYLFQSQRPAHAQSSHVAAGPMVFIASDWTAETTHTDTASTSTATTQTTSSTMNSPRQIRVFSNAEQVALYLNGRLLDTRTATRQQGPHSMSDRMAHPPFEFHVPAFVPGLLHAKAFINGKVVAEHQVHTPAAASAIQIEVDDIGPAPAPFDEVFIKAQLIDQQGHPVRSSGINIEVTSPDLDIVNPQPLVTERGVAVVLVKTGAAGLKGSLTFTAKGLPAATMRFNAGTTPSQVSSAP